MLPNTKQSSGKNPSTYKTEKGYRQMSPVSFFLFVNIVRVMDIQLHIPIISLLSQTETFLQFLLKFLRDK